MTAYEDLMKEFMDKYSQYRRGTNDPGPVPITVVLLRLRLIVEELGEFYEAYQSDAEFKIDRVGTADALGDLAYVIVGTIVTYGFPVHADAVLQNGGNPLGSEEIAHDLGIAMGGVAVQLHEYAMDPDSPVEKVTNCLHDMLYTVIMSAKSLAIPIDEVFREIHRSNMTKATPTISAVPGQKYGIKIGSGGKGPLYSPPNLKPILGIS